MIKYKSFFQDRMPYLIHNMAQNYTKTNLYLTVDDLKRKALTDLFIVNRVLQRFLLTMKVRNKNSFELQVATRAEWFAQKIQDTFSAILSATTEKELETPLTALDTEFAEVLPMFTALIGLHSQTQLVGDYRDIFNPECDGIKVDIPIRIFSGMTTDSSFVNVFFPFPDADVSSFNVYDLINRLKLQLPIHLYGFSTINHPHAREYYKYLTNNWNRCNIRYSTFDAVLMTYTSAFGGNFQEYKRGYNYVRPGGSIILYGMRSDMIPTQLEKLATTLSNVQVFFFSHSNELQGQAANDFFILVGKKEQTANYREQYFQLLSLFLTGANEEKRFSILGSETDVVPFRSYSMTEDEYIAATASIQQAEKTITDFLFPKRQEENRRPLLPFTSGQLGLVLISGDIDGVIEEKESHCCHAVKGYSARDTSTREEPILNNNDVQIGTKKIKLNYPITMVRIIKPNGDILQIGG